MRLPQMVGGLSLAGDVSGGIAELPAWVSALPLWQWYEIPNTAMSSIAPSPTPPGQAGPSSKINAWCGATLRRQGSIYMLGAAGGHSDYCGNEVNALALNVETPAWVQLRAPTATADVWERTPVYADLRRSAVHTYWATQYDDANDRMLIFSSGGPFDTAGVDDCPPEWPYQQNEPVLMAYDRAAGDWLAPDALTPFPFGSTSSADLCCTDPVNGDVYYAKSQQGRLWRYRPSTDTWSDIGAWYLNGAQCGAAVDHARGRLFYVGDSANSRTPGMRNIVDGSDASPTFGGLGASALVMNGYPGVVFDEANDCFLVAKNDASTIEVYRVDADTLEIDMPEVAGTKPAKRQNAICNAFQYVPELRGVVVANSYTGNVQFMRTAA